MRNAICFVALMLIAGCGGTNGSGVSGSGGVAGSGGGSGTGGGGGGGSMGGMVGPDDVVLEMTPFVVPAGSEAYRCQNFANPFDGQSFAVAEWESHMAVGSHHLLVFYKPNATNGSLETCSGLEFGSGPYGAQTPDAKLTYPDGVAAVIDSGVGLRFASHYLNATQQDIMATVKLIIRPASTGSVQNRAGVLFFNKIDLYIPKDLNPSSPTPYTVTKSCSIPRDVYFMFATGHFHRHGQNLTAKIGSTTLYSTSSWDFSPFQAYAPPMLLKAGTVVDFSCTYLNDTQGALTFGESAQTNEMCIFDGQFYPDPSGQGFGC